MWQLIKAVRLRKKIDIISEHLLIFQIGDEWKWRRKTFSHIAIYTNTWQLPSHTTHSHTYILVYIHTCLDIVRYFLFFWYLFNSITKYMYACIRIRTYIGAHIHKHHKEKSAWWENTLYTYVTRIHAMALICFQRSLSIHLFVYGMLFSTLSMVNACVCVCVRLCWGITTE